MHRVVAPNLDAAGIGYHERCWNGTEQQTNTPESKGDRRSSEHLRPVDLEPTEQTRVLVCQYLNLVVRSPC